MDKVLAVDTSYTTVAIPQRRIYPCSMNFQMLNKCNRNKKIVWMDISCPYFLMPKPTLTETMV